MLAFKIYIKMCMVSGFSLALREHVHYMLVSQIVHIDFNDFIGLGEQGGQLTFIYCQVFGKCFTYKISFDPPTQQGRIYNSHFTVGNLIFRS